MHLDSWVLRAAIVDLGRRREEEYVGQGPRLGSVTFLEGGELGAVVVGVHHRGELGGVVLGLAVMEDDRGQRVWQDVHGRGRERGRFDDAAQGVALSAALDAEEADGVGLVEVERDGSASDFAEDTVLGRGTGDAEKDVRLEGIRGNRTE